MVQIFVIKYMRLRTLGRKVQEVEQKSYVVYKVNFGFMGSYQDGVGFFSCGVNGGLELGGFLGWGRQRYWLREGGIGCLGIFLQLDFQNLEFDVDFSSCQFCNLIWEGFNMFGVFIFIARCFVYRGTRVFGQSQAQGRIVVGIVLQVQRFFIQLF